ncbi:MAG: LCP family protein [Chloroflexi bacterium]|nr:LCP family protein [Chloroflexota bacterium]MCY4248646.1 LCP family protein [Chloroflexota bacterium]
MRLRGCLGALFVGSLLVALTSVCAFGSFTLAQQTVVDLGASGFRVDDPVQTLRCLATQQCADESANEAPPLLLTPKLTSMPADSPPTATQRPAPQIALAPSSTPPTLAALPSSLPPVDPRAITLLLMGIDQRRALEDDGPFRTDTMILLHVNPARRTVGVLSLPRDLWVRIPGFGESRINTANFKGDGAAYPGGGPALAMATIYENFGLRVDKYLLVNFEVFITLVDTLAPNGLPITITEFIDDPYYPDEAEGYNPVRFEPGEYRLAAESLLQYARTRATPGGDFDRARRQQQVLDAVRAHVLSAGGIATFISQAPYLWGQLQDNFSTNLELNDILSLGQLMGNIQRDDIRYSVISNLHVVPGTSSDGQQILIPNLDSIRDLVLRTFYPPDLSSSDLLERARQEAAPIVVWNGTQVDNLARDTKNWLEARGFIVTDISSEQNRFRRQTEIRVYGRYSWTAQALADLLGVPGDRILPSGDRQIARGVLILLGADAPAVIGG